MGYRNGSTHPETSQIRLTGPMDESHSLAPTVTLSRVIVIAEWILKNFGVD